MKLLSGGSFAVEPKTLQRALEVLLERKQGITRGELAEHLRVSPMTAGKIAERLLDLGVLTEVQSAPEKGRKGRRPCVLKYNEFAEFCLLELGRCGRILRVGMDGRILQFKRFPYNDAMSAEDHWQQILYEGKRVMDRAEKDKRVIMGILLSEDGENPAEMFSLLGCTPRMETMAALTQNELTRKEYGKTNLYISVREHISTTLTVRGQIITENCYEWSSNEAKSFVEDVTVLCRFLKLDRILIEGTDRYAAECRAVAEGLKSALDNIGNAPDVVEMKELSLAEKNMLRLLRKDLIGQLIERLTNR